MAERHGARLLEADCATTTARLLAESGRTEEAAETLAAAVSLFHAMGVNGRPREDQPNEGPQIRSG
jgi:hypothetical protein